MSKFDELLRSLKESNQSQLDSCWEENIPNELYEAHFMDNYELVAEGLDVDTHRWFERSTVVVKIHGRFLGINLITNVFSDGASVDDVGGSVEYFEMEEVNVISYEQKI